MRCAIPFAIVCAVAGSARAAEPPGPALEQLVAEVRRGDMGAQLRAKALGPSVAPALIPLLADARPSVRTLALYCLVEAGAPDAPAAAARALADPDEEVRRTGLRMLDKKYDDSLAPTLLAIARSPRAADVRAGVIRLLARLPSARLDDLRTLCRAHPEPTCTAALARLGDPDARAAWARALAASREQVRKRLLDELELLRGGPSPEWLIPPLTALLDDKSDALFLYESFGPGTSQHHALRVCDVAVNTLAKLGVHSAVRTDGATNYSDAQLSEVRAAARAASKR